MLKNRHTVAIMQPYFIPYSGYFRLMVAADTFVLYDCVQFPRRGFVHRNKLIRTDGILDWLSLPISSCKRETLIRDLRFQDDWGNWWEKSKRRFLALQNSVGHAAHLTQIIHSCFKEEVSPIELNEVILREVKKLLKIECEFIRSSDLEISSLIKGEDRIIAIAKAVGCKTYVNSPGGRNLYDPRKFTASEIDLCFLSDYIGSYASILERLRTEEAELVKADLQSQSIVVSNSACSD